MRPVISASVLACGVMLALPPIAVHAANPPPEDGPWSGEISCRYEAQAANYQDQQIHTWRLTASAPANPGLGGIRYYDATWSATGGGQRVIPATGATETWRLDVPAQDGRLGIWQPPNSGRLRFASQHSGIVTPAALRVAGPQPMVSAGYELSFQFVEGPASSAQISGSRERMYAGPVGWRQPPAVPTRETCVWNFARSATAPPAGTLPPTMTVAVPPAAPPEAPTSTPTATSPTTPPVLTARNPIPVTPPASPTFTAEPTQPSPQTPTSATTTPPPPPSRPTRPTIPSGSGNPTAPTTFASYLISVTQLVCGQPTQDDPLSFDGRGDEIKAAVQVWHFNRANGQLLGSFWRESLAYGDANRSNRIQAGSVSSEGGIRALDRIPDGSSVARVAAASDQVFPWRVWEGSLATGQDAVVIAPSIWEVDGSRPALDTYRVRMRNVPPASIIAMPAVQSRMAETSLRVFELGSSEAGGTFGAVGNAAFDTFATFTLGGLGLPFLTQLVSHREDRPIGLRADRLPTTAVVVTREIAEAALQATGFPQVLPTATPGLIFIVPKPGMLVIEFRDLATGTEADARAYIGVLNNPLARTDAQYFMVMQIERL